MAEQRQGATYFTFKGGLNTEASSLNASPEDAADIVNVELTDAATLRRRKGIDFLPSLSSSTQLESETTDYTSVESTFVDPAPSQISFRVVKTDGSYFRILVVHIGNKLYIYNQDNLSTLADISDYRQAIPLPSVYPSKRVHYKTFFIKDANRVYLCNPHIPLCYIVYNESGDNFDFITEEVRVRDLNESVQVDDRVTHNGNTYRAILDHTSSSIYEPGVGAEWLDVWVLEGKAPSSGAPSAWSTGTGSVVYIEEDSQTVTVNQGSALTLKTRSFYRCISNHTAAAGNAPPDTTYWELIARQSTTRTFTAGYYLGQGVTKGATVWTSGASYTAATQEYNSNIEVLVDNGGTGYTPGFNCGALASGRLWLANPTGSPNTLYFSQSITEDFNYGRLFQWADPNNPDDPDVVETDGGKLILTNAEEIVGLAEYRGGVLVLATNGIWYITGSDGYFKATTYSIQRITDDGCVGRHAWTYVENSIIYAGVGGVYAISLDEVSALPTVQEASKKIKSFWTGIPRYQRAACEIAYNPDTSQVVFGINFDTSSWWADRNLYEQAVRHRDFLIFDVGLGAWYKYRMSTDDDGEKLCPASIYPIVANIEDKDVVTVGGANVTVNLVDVQIATESGAKQTIISTISVIKDGDNVQWSLCRFSGSEFQDYSRNDTYAESYDGWVQSVPQLYSDIGHRKQVAYLHTAFERVEDGFDQSTLTYTNPGGCYYRVLWDWAQDSTAGTKYGDAYQAYKPNKYNLVYEDGELIGFDVVRNKHRIRGSGRAVSFRFETEENKDFHLLGWQSDIYASAKV